MQILNLDGNEIRLHMWDLQGQDRVLGTMNKIFCKDASGAIVVADSMEEASIYNTATWKQNVNELM